MSILVLLILVAPTLVCAGIITFDVIDAFIIQGENKMMAPIWFWEVLIVAGVALPVVLTLADEVLNR